MKEITLFLRPVVQTELNARTAIKCTEEMNSPLILLVPLIFDYDVDLFGRYLKQLAEASSVPIAVNQDHGADYESAVECIRAGFSSIMVDRSQLPYEENVAQVKEIVKLHMQLEYLLKQNSDMLEMQIIMMWIEMQL